MKRERKEKILVLVSGGAESLRWMDEGCDAAREAGGELYILHVEQGSSMDLEQMAALQEVAEYGGRLGGIVCFGCGEDVAAYVGGFARQKGITEIFAQPPEKERKSRLAAWLEGLRELLPPETRLFAGPEWAMGS
ncbi:hypothetical protein H9X85_07945 [Anaerotignum lactatifermentans]|uniref:UspA domain-containing protein n=1 Tax=Anaerotignum lactatifermentans TaxID=160404 RepID=A0ABS2G977_9FIRM|nr:hypothetical protein [Anaerotignum lactatifermentans]MBM6829537.1 hypothetical protein [Anaerotignum lactatifermentans]MBM6878031.1 hypothetical protein [Anaerotignum lactatifermentans]MBM6951139.1 hypothetical protein [Anaerotignum lactatifermentans]